MTRIALLSCGALPPPLDVSQGDYAQVFSRLFHTALPDQDFLLDAFDVVNAMEYPSDDSLDKYTAIVLTGSASNAYDDIEWINKLVAYIARIAETKPSMKIIGICFGHQIVARALGGKVVWNDGKWEVGPTVVTLTDLGKSFFGVNSFHIQQMHRDHVPSVPPNFHLLGSTPISYNQGMVRFRADKTPIDTTKVSFDDIQILTLQGHPEFNEPIVSELIRQRRASGLIDQQTATEAEVRKDWPNDGFGIIGRTLWGVLGV
ncbi:hypothetical protein AMATHDRAFT_74819 [Amanita thiersii Skay4041]|uniref:Glutamine amidotransferase domain-containing protein n=1 Tax=Amanita thiersii Skay4041 TaxID=703135 RepID=A0A2A9NM66_9AGAR|nr:hypothetical protein AMATHDRAFT_74819 [Amanita thiersii Skay4041]